MRNRWFIIPFIVAFIVAFTMACTIDNLPRGKITTLKHDTGTTWNVCVKAEENANDSWVDGEVICKGNKKDEDVKGCAVGKVWPDCRTNKRS